MLERVIDFIETYWGFALGGGLTLGTVVTFTIVQLKSFAKDKLKNSKIGELLATIDTLVKRDEVRAQELSTSENRQKYLELTIAHMFKNINYLTMASKLTIEDKLDLQKGLLQIEHYADTHDVDAKPLTTGITNAVTEVKTGVDAVAPQVITAVVKQATSLLDKYVQVPDVKKDI